MYQFLKNTAFTGLLLLLFWAGTSKFGGSPGGKTGSPIDGSNCTGCHSGADIISKDTWINTNIPQSGYVPGTTYEVKINAYHQGSKRIGFEITSETVTKKVGIWELADTVNTQFTNDSTAVTHTSKGTAASDSISWTMKWTAPEAGSGNVSFYAAVNATNSDLSSSGDQVYLSAKTVIEAGTNNVNKIGKKDDFIHLWPNPAGAYLNIRNDSPVPIKLIEIIDSHGKILKSVKNIQQGFIALDKIPLGVFFLRIYVSDKIYTKTFVKF
jgi:hypothetical protein